MRTIIGSGQMGAESKLEETLGRPLREILEAFRGGDHKAAAMPK